MNATHPGPLRPKRDFLSLHDCTPDELRHIVARAIEMKAAHRAGTLGPLLAGKSLVMIFQLASTRTRVGFEAGIGQLGGHAIVLNPADTQLGRGEPIEDTARVMSEMVDAVVIRTRPHDDIVRFANASRIPVINAMTGLLHPCQLLADIQTFEELRGPIAGRRVAFVGDGYNICNSYLEAATQWGFELRVACPAGFEPTAERLKAAPNATLFASPEEAVAGADLVVTDVWSSMGHEDEAARRRQAFAGYQVNEALLDRAGPQVLFMHCLPAHRGEEISTTLLDDPRSVAWQEAGNRLHTQKALLEFLLA
jgi:ornithine carbamoyltransferase